RNAHGANDSACRATKSRALVAGLPVIASTLCVTRSYRLAAWRRLRGHAGTTAKRGPNHGRPERGEPCRLQGLLKAATCVGASRWQTAIVARDWLNLDFDNGLGAGPSPRSARLFALSRLSRKS